MENFRSASSPRYILKFVAVLLALFAIYPAAVALSPESYAPQSVLAEGRWVRVTVSESGLHLISTADLRRYGFTDPTAVKVYGYGGQRIPDLLDASTYVDDLTPVGSELTRRGIVFYAEGPESWSKSTSPTSGIGFTHSMNPYSTTGNYFLTDRDDLPGSVPLADGTPRRADDALTTFTQCLFHETDLTSPGESGHLLVGEDFTFTRSRTFNFPVPGIVESDPTTDVLSVAYSFVSNTSTAGTLSTSINSEAATTTRTGVNSGSSSFAVSNNVTASRQTWPKSESQLSLKIDYTNPSSVKGAWLDAIDVNYLRNIAMHDGMLHFTADRPGVTLTGATETTRVWDVTDPSEVKVMNTSAPDGGSLSWVNAYGGTRTYAAWDESARFPSPEFAQTVANQNIHGAPVPDMVIVTVADWRQQAERLADLHRNSADSLDVLVVDAQSVYNEFSSGTADINAIRRMAKMFWDRGNVSGERRLRYLLMFGRATHDNRQLTAPVRSLREGSLPCWQTDNGLSEFASYMTDDFLAMLEDGSGLRLGSDKLCIGVGRAQVGTTAEARNFVDKIETYTASSSRSGVWKNRMMIVADDGDRGKHMEQSESMLDEIAATESGRNLLLSKIYVDAFDEVGGQAVKARERMHREIEDGVMLWTYVGHGDKRSMTSEKLLTFTDAPSMTARNLPFLYAATCSFLKWDGIEKSGCELMFHNTRGGIIGAICPTREVYISENEYMTDAFGRHAFRRDSEGRLPAVGDIMRSAKNDLKRKDQNGNQIDITTNENKLRYVLMGDPAMRLAMPEPIIRIEQINGMDVDPDNQVTLMARQRTTVSGSVFDGSGSRLLADFNGTVTVSLFDAENTVTTQGRPSDNTQGEPVNFEQQGELLFSGSGKVADGKFTVDVAMPSEVADNFRPATLSAYARSTDGREAAGVNRDFYVYGYDETAETDTIAPTIEYACLNHTSFKSGDHVNPSPMFLASVSDNVGINMAQAGIGHQMLVRIDGRESYTNVASFFTPAPDRSASGTIAYPLDNLADGEHTLSFRVWDTSGNSTTATFDFYVRSDLAPTLFDVYTDANPASVEANFYLSHNRPDSEITVTVEVFNMQGRLEWTSTVTDRSDMFLSAPLTWNLCDRAGHRVPRGIYLYRATVTSDGNTSSSVTRRIAVTGK